MDKKKINDKNKETEKDEIPQGLQGIELPKAAPIDDSLVAKYAPFNDKRDDVAIKGTVLFPSEIPKEGLESESTVSVPKYAQNFDKGEDVAIKGTVLKEEVNFEPPTAAVRGMGGMGREEDEEIPQGLESERTVSFAKYAPDLDSGEDVTIKGNVTNQKVTFTPVSLVQEAAKYSSGFDIRKDVIIKGEVLEKLTFEVPVAAVREMAKYASEFDSGEDTVINGTTLSESKKTPVEGIKISVKGLNHIAYTNKYGSFTIYVPKQDAYELKIESPSKTIEKKINLEDTKNIQFIFLDQAATE